MYVLVNAESGERMSDDIYLTAQDAEMARGLYLGVKTRIKMLVDDSWMCREGCRLYDGTYTKLPDYLDTFTQPHHFAHVAKQDPLKLAFTATPEKGMQDIQTVISVSTYLGRFTALSGDQIRDLAARYESRNTINDDTLVIDYTRKAFRFAYDSQPVKSESSDHTSCMARSARSYTADFTPYPHIHPAEAYSTDQDGLHIAYTTDPRHPNTVTARAVVWPKHMHFVRVYGLEERDRIGLQSLLQSRGYTRHHSFEGAPLARIGLGCDNDDTDGTFLMPYIDGDTKTVDDHPSVKRFYICDSGDYAADETSGYIEVGSGGRYNSTCDHCGDRMHSDDAHRMNGDLWCESCYENEAIYCEYYEESYPSHDGFTSVYIARYAERGVDGFRRRDPSARPIEQTWCDDAAGNYAFYCDHTDRHYHAEHFTSIEVVVDRHGNTETWCMEQTTDDWFRCDECGLNYDIDLRYEHSDLLGEAVICVDCHKANEAESEGRGYAVPIAPLPVYIDDRRQLEMALPLPEIELAF